MDRTIELTDPKALRAVAHPTRLTLLALVRREGAMTATRAAAALGETPQRCTYHFRQLAKYGLVERAEGGRGRECPWKATALFTAWRPVADGATEAAAASAFETVLLERYFGAATHWVQTRANEPPEWQRAAVFGDVMLYLTHDELEELGRRQQEILRPFIERTPDQRERPPASRPIMFVSLAFPMQASSERSA